MSAQFIVLYREQPVRFVPVATANVYEVVSRDRASVFTSEADAWFEAYRYDLNPMHLRVVSL